MNEVIHEQNGDIHTLRTRLAPLRKPCADTARLSVGVASLAQPAAAARSTLTLTARRRERGLACFVLQLVQPFASLGHLGDVLAHDTYGVVNLLLDSSRLWIARACARAAGGVRGRATSGKVWIVRFRPACIWCQRHSEHE